MVRGEVDRKNITLRALDTTKNGLNITTFGDRNAAALVCNGPHLGLIIRRTMHRSPDGLNHQGAISLVLDSGSHAIKPGRAGKTFPRYDEISAHGDTRYKWSNDNATYTELAGAVPVKSGIAVIFAGERCRGGRTMDNSRALDRHLDPRNLAVILVRDDFEKLPRPRGSMAPEGIALSAGMPEKGGIR